MARRHTSFVVASSFAFLLGSCLDPGHSDAVDALGPEDPNVPDGPLHRPGQPCLVCHGLQGPGPQFAFAGTIYKRRGSDEKAVNVTVVLTDAFGTTKSLTTNHVGNFFLDADKWAPTYPVFVELQSGGVVKEMKTRIGRDGGCGSCHQGEGKFNHMPFVYLEDQP